MTRVKSRQLNMRVSERDFEIIKKRADKAKVNVSAYMLIMALKGKIVVVEGLPEVAKEIRYIGNNLNQLTKLCHEGRIECINLDETREEVRQLWQRLSLQTQRDSSKKS